MLRRLFLDHPKSVDETYLEHMRMAGGFSGELLRAGFACLIHALIPAFCTTTASDIVKRLNTRLTNRNASAHAVKDGANVAAN